MRFSCRPVAGAWATAALVTAALIPAVLIPAALAAPAAPRTDVVGDARQQAADLRLRVDALQLQAEQASENYDAAYDALGRAVTAHVAAGRQLDVARASADASDGQAGRRVRALYMAGGGTGLYASVLNSGDLPDALRRLHQVDAVLVGDHRAAADAGQAFAQRRTADAHLQAAALTAVRLQRTVADRADAVRALLAQTDALMAHADARVVALAAQQRLDEQAAAARRAAIVLAAAQARAAAALTASQARAAAALTAAQARAAASTAVPQARGERQRGVASNPGSLLPATDPTAPGPAATSPGPASSASVAAVLDFARAQLGKPYVWGATGPDSYDCSGLTQAAYAVAGTRLPRVAQDQWFAGAHVELGELQPGDLLFWASDTSAPATIHHVALYLGGGQILAAPHTGDVVKIEPLYLNGYIGAVRPTPGH